MQTEIIPTEQMMKELGTNKVITELIMKTLGLSAMNEMYTKLSRYEGIELIEKALDLLNISFEVSDEDLAKIPTEGAFISISNHPYGLLDGVLLLQLMNKVRPDFKVTANHFLEVMKPFQDLFISVDPFGKKKLNAFSKVLKTLEEGNSIGLFPAGEVSTYYNSNKKIEDRPWTKSSIRLIQEANIPVVPVYFHGVNSWMFHLLGKVHPSLRTMQIPKEFLNKKGNKVKIRIGQPIQPKEYQKHETIEELSSFLRNKTYLLGEGLKSQKFLKPNKKVKEEAEPLFQEIPKEVLESEIKDVSPSSLLFSQKQYDVYICPSEEIPYILLEIGRLREKTFREVGEGTNHAIDLDRFDEYYQHLFIWDREESRVIGSYRIGKGDEIMEFIGKKGFYTNTLFKFKKEFKSILKQGIELGRSFVIKEKQKDAFPLFFLWKGINIYLKKNPHYRYMFGSVSISNDYSNASKDAIIYYSHKFLYNDELSHLIKPRKKYKITSNVQEYIDSLTNKEYFNINELDKLLMEIDSKKYKVPVLIRQYIKLNGKIIGFNIDPKFNNCLDGFILVDVLNIPQKVSNQLN